MRDALAHFWKLPTTNIALQNDEVHVWRAMLDQPPSLVKSLLRALAPDEQERSERFYFQKDRDAFIVARGVLRNILGRYVNLDPSQLRFCYSAFGKPSLAGMQNQIDLRFNLSHSHGVALFAVACSREIGVDVEQMRPDVATEQIARRFFSRVEVTALLSLPASLQAEAFFNCWTRKEAYIKARGEGFSLPLDKFDVSLVPGQPAALLGSRVDPEEVYCWSLTELTPGPGFAAALVVEHHDWRLKRWQWFV
jgi:4'-phosphopantetheinyl transferase